MSTSVFLGIGGAGMKGLAYLLRERGETVIGFDDNSDTTEIPLEQAVKALQSADRLVYTDAALATHPLREAALEKNVTQVPYQQALGEFSRTYTTIGITGTHGKSSTTSFLAHICIEAGLDPTVLVGASVTGLPGEHARLGKGNLFIVEADEYRRHFLELSPSHIIITSIDFDHPDAFSSLQEVEGAYQEFINSMKKDGTLVLPEKEKEAHSAITFPDSTIAVPENTAEDILVSLPGAHMRMNGALAVALAELLGVTREDAIKSLATFPGLMRRFELVGQVNGCDIRSDYGHHPAEIASTITGAREVYPNSHLIAVFEAHMPFRLHAFLNDFASALARADEVVIVPPFAPVGRDTNLTQDAQKLQIILREKGISVRYTEHHTEFLSTLHGTDVAILFSAGSLDGEVRKTVKKA